MTYPKLKIAFLEGLQRKDTQHTHTQRTTVLEALNIFMVSWAMKANLLYHTLYLPPWSLSMISMIHHALPAAWILIVYVITWDVDTSHWLFNIALNHRSRWRHKIGLLYWKHRNAYVQIRSDHPGWWESGFFCSWCHERPWLRSSESTTSFTNVSPCTFCFEQASSNVPSDMTKSGYLRFFLLHLISMS